MDNQTIALGFEIIAFSSDGGRQPLLFIVFFLMYLTGVLENAIIFTLVLTDQQLHTPMYVFLMNLSTVDMFYLSIPLPKLMYILLTGDNFIKFSHCYLQMSLYNFICSTEIFLLSVMAFDRYVAICKPLHYSLIMHKKNIALFLVITWVSGGINSLFVMAFAFLLSFCDSHKIHHFYCDSKALTKIACSSEFFSIVLYTETSILTIFPFVLSLSSYGKIVKSILHIKSAQSRRKTFSTCSSHLAVLTIFYGTTMCAYLSSGNSELLDQMFSVLYTAVTPMLNPLIYSLQNKEVTSALHRTLVKIGNISR
ncbi:olfactory receptor-like protein OLF4 [Rhinoderma darwinii]|uniref:olfactory receptor-like protein OLF4 n=1 Tax=Rhinoderma darwinii TaxID=43563 RepID=UPI003F669812